MKISYFAGCCLVVVVTLTAFGVIDDIGSILLIVGILLSTRRIRQCEEQLREEQRCSLREASRRVQMKKQQFEFNEQLIRQQTELLRSLRGS
jgi:hypothetical protein